MAWLGRGRAALHSEVVTANIAPAWDTREERSKEAQPTGATHAMQDRSPSGDKHVFTGWLICMTFCHWMGGSSHISTGGQRRQF